MPRNLNKLTDKAKDVVSTSLELSEKEKATRVFTRTKDKVKKVVRPVVNVTTDSKDVIKAIKESKAKPLDIAPLIEAVDDLADKVEDQVTDFDPLIEAVKESKVDMEPIVEALAELKDKRADQRVDELADRFEKALKELPEKMPRMTGGGAGTSGKLVDSTCLLYTSDAADE